MNALKMTVAMASLLFAACVSASGASSNAGMASGAEVERAGAVAITDATRLESQYSSAVSRCIALARNSQASSMFGPESGKQAEAYFIKLLDPVGGPRWAVIEDQAHIYRVMELTPDGLAYVRADEGVCIRLRQGN